MSAKGYCVVVTWTSVNSNQPTWTYNPEGKVLTYAAACQFAITCSIEGVWLGDTLYPSHNIKAISVTEKL